MSEGDACLSWGGQDGVGVGDGYAEHAVQLALACCGPVPGAVLARLKYLDLREQAFEDSYADSLPVNTARTGQC